MVNDDERNPYADGVDAPFIKLKRRDPNLGDCSNHMCFETLSYASTLSGMSNEMQHGNTAAIIAKYRGNYTAYSETGSVDALPERQGSTGPLGMVDAAAQKWMMAWSVQPPEYSGGSRRAHHVRPAGRPLRKRLCHGSRRNSRPGHVQRPGELYGRGS